MVPFLFGNPVEVAEVAKYSGSSVGNQDIYATAAVGDSCKHCFDVCGSAYVRLHRKGGAACLLDYADGIFGIRDRFSVINPNGGALRG
jgi:hypothetical protein